MRNDLLDAIAGVEWADAQLKILEARIDSWRNASPYQIVEELHPENGEKLYKLANIKPLPPAVNAEAGLIINSLRSSLDLLANTLAARHGFPNSEDTQFPICLNEARFRHGKHAGRKEIKRLSAADQKIIEDLKPWAGGHPHLFSLHTLDNTRKHRRLVGTKVLPVQYSVSPLDSERGFRFPGVWKGFENDAIVGWTKIDAPKPDVQVSTTVTLSEGGLYPTLTLKGTLEEFSTGVREIIKLFDVS